VTLGDRFDEIYATNEWGGGSGEGSLPQHTRAYVALVQAFLRAHDIRTVVDLGCGDWQVSQEINWGRIRYIGVDVVRTVIERNNKYFSNRRIRFFRVDDERMIPEADLLIAKDVLQHWSIERIQRFRPVIDRYKHVLLTNCIGLPHEKNNTPIPDGHFRPIDLTAAPFEWPLEPLACFTNVDANDELRWIKQVLIRA
jgi:SAM-dependent methyltransferase